MANRYAIATGNWSNPAIWDGGVSIPAPGDTVRSNLFTVTIDQDLTGTAYTLANNTSAPAVQGGGFVVSTIPGGGRTLNVNVALSTTQSLGVLGVTATSGTLTINGNITGNVASTYGLVISGSGATVIVNGDVSGGTTSSSIAVRVPGNTTLTINGNVTGGSGSQAYGVSLNNATVTLTVTGTVTGGAGSSCSGIDANNAPGTITITGNVTGGGGSGQGAGVLLIGGSTALTIHGDVAAGNSAFGGAGVYLSTSATGTVTINGNVTGSPHVSVSAVGGVNFVTTSATAVTINGNVTGGANSVAYGVHVQSTGAWSLTVTGTVTATAARGIYVNAIAPSTSIIDVQGAVAAATGASGIDVVSTASTMTRIGGPITDASNGRAAVVVPFLIVPALPEKATLNIRGDAGFPTVGSNVVLTNYEDEGLPDPTDVRLGVVYGPGGAHTGVLPTAITAQAVWDVLVADLDTPGSIGARLRDAATVASTGAQLAAALDSL